MNYVPVIGLEIHAELTTNSKLFCRCPNTSHDLDTPPNTAVCPVCLGLPGALPVLNRKAVLATKQLGQSLGSTIPTVTKWDRKNYFYPDLPKGYQISQYDQPLCAGGVLRWFDRDGEEHSIALTRVHLEEDTGKLIHTEGNPPAGGYSYIDYNRSSIPLLELVTEPVITSAQEARQFGEEYQLRLRELGVAEASMEKGQMRCEANISIIPEELAQDPVNRLSGTKVEIKNLNSFRSLERAINYEIDRQTKALENGEKLVQETRGWNEVKGETYAMRTKETADDYRYFPEPDLGALHLADFEDSDVTVLSRFAIFKELVDLGGTPDQVYTLTNDVQRLHYLQSLIRSGLPKEAHLLAAQWINQEPRLMTFDHKEATEVIRGLAEKKISAAVFKDAILTALPGELEITLEEMVKIQSIDNLSDVVAKVLKDNEQEVARYKAGQQQLLGYFVGQIRKELQGKGDPAAISQELRRQLSG